MVAKRDDSKRHGFGGLPGILPQSPSTRLHATGLDSVNVSGAAPVPIARHDAPGNQEALERQLAILFGESLFGSWPELGSGHGATHKRPKRHIWLWRVASLVVLVGLLIGVRALFRTGIDRHSMVDREQLAEQLGQFLADGNLEKSSEFIALVRGERSDFDPNSKHLDTLIRAEAAAYRYFDADPKRLQRILPHLKGGSAAALTAPRLIASIAILSREERAAHLPVLEKLRAEHDKDSELFYLIATALESKKDITRAREAWTRSANLGPMWLSHRFEQAQFEKRQGNDEVASKIAEQMLRSNADSAWSQLAARTFGTRLTPSTTSVSADAATPVIPPVQIFHVQLLEVIAAAKRGDLGGARKHLLSAVATVNGEPPFLLDAFDTLFRVPSEKLARALTELPEWPQNSPVAAAKRDRLSKAPSN